VVLSGSRRHVDTSAILYRRRENVRDVSTTKGFQPKES
jgi:hypothetical protein